MNFRISILLIALFFSPAVHASIPGLEMAYDRLLWRTNDKIVNQKSISSETPTSCHQQALDIRQDGKIDITVVFGYMDVSGGQEFNDSGNHLYGRGHVLDLDAKNALKGVLTSSCVGKQFSACGFRASGDKLTKRIRDRWTNQRLKITIHLASPAVSGSNSANAGQYQGRQAQASAKVKNTFLSGLQNSDATIYMGHARSGGGPDFLPPVLYNNGKVNYSYYKNKQEGIKSMLGALQAASRPSPIIGVLACKSTRLFKNSISKKAPDSVIITADALFDYNDILPTGYAILEGVISQRCSSEFTKVVKVQPTSQNFLKLFY